MQAQENKDLHHQVLYKVSKARKKHVVPDEIAIQNFNFARPDIFLFRTNVKEAVKYTGISFTKFWAYAKANGIPTCRRSFGSMQRFSFPSYLFLATFARLLGIQMKYLLDENLPELLKTGEVKPNILVGKV